MFIFQIPITVESVHKFRFDLIFLQYFFLYFTNSLISYPLDI